MKGILGAIAIGAATLFSGGASQAAVVSVLTPFTGDPAEVTVTVEQAGSQVQITVENTGVLADLRGLFFDIAGFNSALTYTAVGANLTQFVYNATGVSNLGGGNNINGGGGPGSTNFGIEIGEPGIGQGDDFQVFSFLFGVTGGTILESDFDGQTVAARVTSVLVNGARGGSSKLIGEFEEVEAVPLPAAAFLLLGGLGALGVAGRRKRAA